MPTIVISERLSTADVGDTWRIWLQAFDADQARAVPDSVTATVTLPDTTTAAMTVTAQAATGLYEITYTLAAAGRHTAVITTASTDFGDDVDTLELLALAVAADPPTVDDVETYLGTTSYTTAEITTAYNAELAAQRHRCDIPADYPADLAEALCRRVAVNLSRRQNVAGFVEGDAGLVRVPGQDVEVRRLERPFWRLIAR